MTTFTKKTTLTIFSITLLVAVLCMATFGILFQMNSVKAEALEGDPNVGWGPDTTYISDVTYHFEHNSVFDFNLVFGGYNQDALYDHCNLTMVDKPVSTSFSVLDLAKLKQNNDSFYVVTFVFNLDTANDINLSGPIGRYGMYTIAIFGGAALPYKDDIHLLYKYPVTEDDSSAGFYLSFTSNLIKVSGERFAGERFIIQLLFDPKISYTANFSFLVYNPCFRYQTTYGHQFSDLGTFGDALDLCVFHNLPNLYYLYSTNSASANSYQQGFDVGRDYGYNNGYNVGYDKGYSNGHADGMSTNGGLTSVIPTTLGAIGSFFKDLFSFEVFGISFFAILGSIGAILLAIWIIKMAKGG